MTVKHPAKFSKAVLERVESLVDWVSQPIVEHEGRDVSLLDPFAGVGTIHQLRVGRPWLFTMGVELEPEWANQSPWTVTADFFAHSFGWTGTHPVLRFDIVCTSPAYGNRMADHHNARDDSKRNTYRHTLGRPLSDNSSASLQWGEEYRDFHERAWKRVFDLTKPGGYFILNVSDHIRKGRKQNVVKWHTVTAIGLGFVLEPYWECSTHESSKVSTPRNGHGANRDARVDGEHVLLFHKIAAG